jgi:hypothetical protein
MVQFVSQVRRPSGEKACSQRADTAVMSRQVYRTAIGVPSQSSSE